jgi:2-polyprenyl-3-methyl-5-hydroxy-6-metoxy-1,4-benzoquinol methylase
MVEQYEIKKNELYFSNIRRDVISFMGKNKDLIVLEVGTGTGATLTELKQTGVAKEIHAYDLVDVCENKEYFDSFTIDNVEQQKELPFKKKYFDAIVLADVLEHLLDAENTIATLLPYLKNDGSIYVSLPNFRYANALYKVVVKGSFQYEDYGIFDKTHLRFFCKKDMQKLFESFPELKIDNIESNLKSIKCKRATLNKLTFGIFEEFLSLQFFLKVSLK